MTCQRCTGRMFIEPDELTNEQDWVCLACGNRVPVVPREVLDLPEHPGRRRYRVHGSVGVA